ncbi:MAG TPA: efflux RND transporter permease subunit [Gammaproteobacteria bacterium]|nr:efflux RND transporter permease subunit [Gammaproteobacteria bacterium]
MTMKKLGISGRIARQFLNAEITPLLALVGLLLGLFAIAITPREEEPQIVVTFANVFIAFPGASAQEVEQLVSTPAEQVLSEISGIKHVYSVSQPGMSTLTVQFKVGQNRTDAIVRLYNKIFSNRDWLPQNLGVAQPVIKPMGIDDVPIVTATLWSQSPTVGSDQLARISHALEAEIKRIPGTRDIYTIGAPQRVVHVLLDPQRLAGKEISLATLRTALQTANSSQDSGVLTRNNQEIELKTGTFLSTAEDVAGLVVGMHQGRPVYLQDVASIRLTTDQPKSIVRFGKPTAKGQTNTLYPAVTLAIAKKPGTNAVTIAEQVVSRLQQLRGLVIPDQVKLTITRNYGKTADAKARKLMTKLLFATLSVVVLVLLTMGWREALIVGAAVIVTLAATLFASWAMGFTLNRVSLFALIFSIGILVDDAIVVVENIHRHLRLGTSNLLQAIPRAVDEVGGPTILATLTVIAALLPMAFVTGLMGPYMSPIPLNASTGMLLSLGVAFIFTPWLSRMLLAGQHSSHEQKSGTRLQLLFHQIMDPLLDPGKGRKRRGLLWLFLMLLIGGSIFLIANQAVILKMLPFDNKSEFQIVVDMPEGTTVEQTARVLTEASAVLKQIPDIINYQLYAGTASPIGFNGLVRQYYLRHAPWYGDIQVNLASKHQRQRKSHDIARQVRKLLQPVAKRLQANIKVVEVPPGPPVMSPLVAEIYGPDHNEQMRIARQIRKNFENTPDVVDIDDSLVAKAPRRILKIDRARAAYFGISQQQVADAITTLIKGQDVAFIHGPNYKYAVPIRLEFSAADKADLEQLLAFKITGTTGNQVPLAAFIRVIRTDRDMNIYHKDLLPVVFVTGDMSGHLDSPLYAMADLYSSINNQQYDGRALPQYFIQQPTNPYVNSLKWDGEWQVTYETFRDMGIAYAVGLLIIYLLIVAQFHSYLVPLIIMAPIPLTLIGILPGHALLDAKFTATSMIGMIALAGIIVRNSILLVDFINKLTAQGMDFAIAVVESAVVRSRPIVLTGIAAMAGAFFILGDPIFKGLAVSLIFGILVSTLLTLVVIPILYYSLMHRRFAAASKAKPAVD